LANRVLNNYFFYSDLGVNRYDYNFGSHVFKFADRGSHYDYGWGYNRYGLEICTLGLYKKCNQAISDSYRLKVSNNGNRFVYE